MENDEVETLLIESNLKSVENQIRILQNNNQGKLIHLKNGFEANDFIFCTGSFIGRNIKNQPKRILFFVNTIKFNDLEFIHKLNTDERTKNITLVVINSPEAVNKEETSVENKLKGAMLLNLFDDHIII